MTSADWPRRAPIESVQSVRKSVDSQSFFLGGITLGLILYEFSQALLPRSTSDWEDIVASLFDGIIAFALLWMVPMK